MYVNLLIAVAIKTDIEQAAYAFECKYSTLARKENNRCLFKMKMIFVHNFSRVTTESIMNLMEFFLFFSFPFLISPDRFELYVQSSISYKD